MVLLTCLGVKVRPAELHAGSGRIVKAVEVRQSFLYAECCINLTCPILYSESHCE